jgi:hypothetical protein
MYPIEWHVLLDTCAVKVPQDIAGSLGKGGLVAKDVETIILSHLHFDQWVILDGLRTWMMVSLIMFLRTVQRRRSISLLWCNLCGQRGESG